MHFSGFGISESTKTRTVNDNKNLFAPLVYLLSSLLRYW